MQLRSKNMKLDSSVSRFTTGVAPEALILTAKQPAGYSLPSGIPQEAEKRHGNIGGLSAGQPFPMDLGQLSAMDLVQACVRGGDEAAWTEFVRRFQPLIASAVRRVLDFYSRGKGALIDDLVQDTYLRLCRDQCRSLRTFVPRHENSVYAFLRVVATTVVLDFLRKRKREFSAEVPMTEDTPEPSIKPDNAEKGAFYSEIDHWVTQNLTERDRAIFWFYFGEGYTAGDLADLPAIGLTQKGVESCIFRITKTLQSHMGRMKRL